MLNLLSFLPKSRQSELEERAQDVQHPVNARKARRIADADRTRRRVKGSRAFEAGQMARRTREDVLRAQAAVVAAGPDAPGNEHRYRNVTNSLEARMRREEKAREKANA